jgi:hypothetical protein
VIDGVIFATRLVIGQSFVRSKTETEQKKEETIQDKVHTREKGKCQTHP